MSSIASLAGSGLSPVLDQRRMSAKLDLTGTRLRDDSTSETAKSASPQTSNSPLKAGHHGLQLSSFNKSLLRNLVGQDSTGSESSGAAHNWGATNKGPAGEDADANVHTGSKNPSLLRDLLGLTTKNGTASDGASFHSGAHITGLIGQMPPKDGLQIGTYSSSLLSHLQGLDATSREALPPGPTTGTVGHKSGAHGHLAKEDSNLSSGSGLLDLGNFTISDPLPPVPVNQGFGSASGASSKNLNGSLLSNNVNELSLDA